MYSTKSNYNIPFFLFPHWFLLRLRFGAMPKSSFPQCFSPRALTWQTSRPPTILVPTDIQPTTAAYNCHDSALCHGTTGLILEIFLSSRNHSTSQPPMLFVFYRSLLFAPLLNLYICAFWWVIYSMVVCAKAITNRFPHSSTEAQGSGEIIFWQACINKISLIHFIEW